MDELLTIESERLILRPYVDADADRVLDIHSRMDVIRWLDDPPHVPMESLDQARAWVARWAEVHERSPHLGGLAIEVKATGIVAGTVLLAELPHSDGEVQIGWHLHPDSVGHGYVTEAALAVLASAFARGIPEIWCDTFVDNDPSAAVARRLGLPELGVLPDPWYGGESRQFLITREQWEARFEQTAANP